MNDACLHLCLVCNRAVSWVWKVATQEAGLACPLTTGHQQPQSGQQERQLGLHSHRSTPLLVMVLESCWSTFILAVCALPLSMDWILLTMHISTRRLSILIMWGLLHFVQYNIFAIQTSRMCIVFHYTHEQEKE